MHNNTAIQEIVTFLNTYEQDSAIHVCDNEFKFRFVGAKLLRSFGLTNENILGKKLHEINLPLANLSRHYARIHLPLLKGTAATIEYVTIVPKYALILHNIVTPIMSNGNRVGLYIKSEKISAVSHRGMFYHKLWIQRGTSNNFISPAHVKVGTINSLTDNDTIIICALMLGMAEKEVAAALSLLSGTQWSRAGISKVILRSIYPKLKVNSRSHLIMKGFESGILERIAPKLLSGLLSSITKI